MGKGKETLHKRKKRGREESSLSLSSLCKENITTATDQNSVAKAFKSSSSSTTTDKAKKPCFKPSSSSTTEKADKASRYHHHRHHHRSDDNNVVSCNHDDYEKPDGCESLSMGLDENYVGGLGVFEFPWLKEGVGGLVCKTEEEDERWWCSAGSFSACLNEIMHNASSGGGESEWWPDMAAPGVGGFAFAAASMDKFEETASACSSILEMEAAAATSNVNHHVDLQQPAV